MMGGDDIRGGNEPTVSQPACLPAKPVVLCVGAACFPKYYHPVSHMTLLEECCLFSSLSSHGHNSLRAIYKM